MYEWVGVNGGGAGAGGNLPGVELVGSGGEKGVLGGGAGGLKGRTVL